MQKSGRTARGVNTEVVSSEENLVFLFGFVQPRLYRW